VAQRLRTAQSNFLAYLDLEREEVFDIYRELQVKIDPNVQFELIVLESIYRTYLSQVAVEEGLMHLLLRTMDSLYTVPKNNAQVELWIRQLSDRFLVKDTLRVAKFSTLAQHESRPLDPKVDRIMIPDDDIVEQAPSTEHPSTVLNSPTVLATVQGFLLHHRHQILRFSSLDQLEVERLTYVTKLAKKQGITMRSKSLGRKHPLISWARELATRSMHYNVCLPPPTAAVKPTSVWLF
jgi:hypothetical protein